MKVTNPNTNYTFDFDNGDTWEITKDEFEQLKTYFRTRFPQIPVDCGKCIPEDCIPEGWGFETRVSEVCLHNHLGTFILGDTKEDAIAVALKVYRDGWNP